MYILYIDIEYILYIQYIHIIYNDIEYYTIQHICE